MARNARIGDSWPAAFDDDRIAVAHTTCLNFDAHLSRAWIGNLQFNDSKTGSSLSHLGCFHGCYCGCGCHKSSPSGGVSITPVDIFRQNLNLETKEKPMPG